MVPPVLDTAEPATAVAWCSDEQIRRGRIFSDLLAFAGELPHRWPGDDLSFPASVWKH